MMTLYSLNFDFVLFHILIKKICNLKIDFYFLVSVIFLNDFFPLPWPNAPQT